MSGLGQKYWIEVIGVLRLIIPVYDKVNKAISLGMDGRFRLDGIQGRILPGNIVLDAGSGYGNMSQLAIKETNGRARIIMHDPILEMLLNVKKFFGPNLPDFMSSCGVFENMPFRNNVFDAVMCGYSLRDAIELKMAISEIHRILKQGGRLIIVDLGKPDNVILRLCVSFYLRYLLTIMAFAAAGKEGLKFKTLYGTYLRWPKNSELCSLLKENFSRVEFDKRMIGGALVVAAYK